MKVLSLLAAASAASAHTIFVQLEAGGTTYPVSYGIRTPSYDGPITDVTSDDLACNGGPNPTTPSDKIITVNAGSTVKAIWRHTLTSGADDVMDASHKGPTLAYLKKVLDGSTSVHCSKHIWKIKYGNLILKVGSLLWIFQYNIRVVYHMLLISSPSAHCDSLRQQIIKKLSE